MDRAAHRPPRSRASGSACAHRTGRRRGGHPAGPTSARAHHRFVDRGSALPAGVDHAGRPRAAGVRRERERRCCHGSTAHGSAARPRNSAAIPRSRSRRAGRRIRGGGPSGRGDARRRQPLGGTAPGDHRRTARRGQRAGDHAFGRSAGRRRVRHRGARANRRGRATPPRRPPWPAAARAGPDPSGTCPRTARACDDRRERRPRSGPRARVPGERCGGRRRTRCPAGELELPGGVRPSGGGIRRDRGEDYELLLTVPRRRESALARLAPRLGCELTRIGCIVRGRPEVRLTGAPGAVRGPAGFDHFRGRRR